MEKCRELGSFDSVRTRGKRKGNYMLVYQKKRPDARPGPKEWVMCVGSIPYSGVVHQLPYHVSHSIDGSYASLKARAAFCDICREKRVIYDRFCALFIEAMNIPVDRFYGRVSAGGAEKRGTH